MKYLQWEEKYSVGVELIDTHHKIFLDIINELYSAITEKSDRNVLDDILKRLVEYTQFHFQEEERCFDVSQYEGAEKHKAAHRAFCARLAEFQDKKEQFTENPFELMDFLEDWFVGHMAGEDKLFGPCFNEHGLK